MQETLKQTVKHSKKNFHWNYKIGDVINAPFIKE